MADKRYAHDPSYGKPPKWGALYRKYCPKHTDPWSRHARLICEEILRDPKSPIRQLLIDQGYEPDHWASSIEVTIRNLWEERRLLAEHAPEYAEARTERQMAHVRKKMAKSA